LCFGGIKVGIIGCGAIGTRIALSIKNDLKSLCVLSGHYDIDASKTQALSKQLRLKQSPEKSIKSIIKNCDIIVECTSAKNTHNIIKEALHNKTSVLTMNVGKLLNADNLFRAAQKNNCHLLIPSGAIAGIDAIKSANLVNIKKINLTTRKPPKGLKNIPYFQKKSIDISKIKKETELFSGNVFHAVKYFPQNINVAATIALSIKDKNKLKVKIITSPKFKTNSHEIEVLGDFGRIFTRAENVPCPDNPKTSYLAVLSGIQTLKQFCSGMFIGT